MAAGPVRLIVTGEIGSGKTQTCASAAAQLREARWQVAGVLSPGVWTDGRKVAIDALDLASGQARRLASRAGLGHQLRGPATPGWQFDADTIAWCNSLLSATADCDLLVVDELGPLEFERGEGLIQGIRAVDGGRFRLALVVVRPRLLQAARQRWAGAEELVVGGLRHLPATVEQALECAGTLMPTRPRNNTPGLSRSDAP